MPLKITENPFSQPRERRDKTATFRMTESEHAVVDAIAKDEKKDIVDLIREGLAHVVESRLSGKRSR